jgi:hypothetical protein
MRDQAVEDETAPLVGVAGRVQEVAQKASTLRNPECQRVPEGAFDVLRVRRIRVPHPRSFAKGGDQIAHRGERAPHHERIAGFVNELVDRSRLPGEAGFDLDLRQLRRFVRLVVGQVRDPLVARNLQSRRFRAGPDGQRRPLEIRARRSVAAMIGPRSDRESIARRAAGDELAPHAAGDGRPVPRPLGHRGTQSHPLAPRQQFAIPTGPDDGEPAAHQKTVAGGRHVVPAAPLIEEPDDPLVPSVIDLVQEAAVAPRGVDGGEHAHVRHAFDLTFVVARRECEINDAPVGFECGIEFEDRAAAQHFVGTGLTELRAVGERNSRLDLEANQFGLDGTCGQRHGPAHRDDSPVTHDNSHG